MDGTPSAKTLRDRLGDFFYAEEVPYGLALLRICLPLALLIAAIPRWPYARELYSLDGAPTPLWDSYGYPGLLPIPSAPIAVACATLYVMSLVTLSVGWMSRTSAAVAMVLTAYLGMLDTLSSLTKFHSISTHFLLLLALSPCGTLWSVDAWLAGRRVRWPGEIDAGYRQFPVWPRRLVQCMVAVVYFAAAITKMQTPTYFSGDQLYFWLLTNVNASNPLGEYMSLWPPMLVAMALGTIVWEITFPFICWRGLPKAGALLMGLFFHIMTIVMLGLVVFPLVYLAAYWTFFDPADIRGFAAWLRRKGRRWPGIERAWRAITTPRFPRPQWATPSMSAAGFAACASLLVAGALHAERGLDVYGGNRTDGRYQLTALDADKVSRMLAADERVRPEDQVLGFDVGSRMFGGMLANTRTSFQAGERAVIECAVVPPHADLWVEANLHDARDRMLHRVGQVMTRERIRSHFHYDWTEAYPPGDYDIVLKIDGQEVTRRRIAIVTTRPAVSATPETAMTR
jgi:hypothetical protein